MDLQLFPFDVQNLTVRVESRVPSFALNFYPPVVCCGFCLSSDGVADRSFSTAGQVQQANVYD